MELKDLRAKNYHIDNELTNLKELHVELIEKWKDGLVKIAQLEKRKRSIN